MKRSGIIENKTAERFGSARLLTIPAAAGYLGLTKWAMRERIWAGSIPVIRFPGGRKMYIDSADLENFIQKNKTVIT